MSIKTKNEIPKNSITIPEDLLGALAQAVPGQKSPLSPLNIKDSKSTPNKMSQLKETGILDTMGQVKNEYRQMIDTLAKARTVTSLRYTAGSRFYELIVSFPDAKNQPTVSALHNNNQLIIETPAAIEEAFTVIDQSMGHSKLSSNNFFAKLTQEEAITLFALMDLARSSNLHALADGTPLKNAAFDLPAIINKVINAKETFQSLAYVIQDQLELSVPTSAPQVEEGLEKLVAKNLVNQKNSKYQLSEELSLVAGRLPIIDGYLTAETGKLTSDGKLIYGNFTALQAGVNDILYFEKHPEEIIVKSATGMQVAGLVAKFLNEPDTIKPPQNTTSTKTQPSKKFCRKCGNPVEPNTKFCENCGNQIFA